MKRIAVCLFVRDAEHDIEEWIAYHCCIGITSFIIYDHGSTDETIARATRFKSVCDIEVIPWLHQTDVQAQRRAYDDCNRRFVSDFEWVLFIDSDEFLVCDDGESLDKLLHGKLFTAGLVFNWLCFGSNGHVTRPRGLMIEEFTHRSDETFDPNHIAKMMVRPDRTVQNINPHNFELKGPAIRCDGTPAVWRDKGTTIDIHIRGWRINHYFVRSREQWDAKLKRGYQDGTIRDPGIFNLYDRNEVEDLTAKRLAPQVHALLARVRAEQPDKRLSILARLMRRLRIV